MGQCIRKQSAEMPGSQTAPDEPARPWSPAVVARGPLLADTGAVAGEEDGPICPVCLGPLGGAARCTLPACAHEFHALCLLSALQASSMCPICRCGVDESVGHDVAATLVAKQGLEGNAILATQLLLDLKARAAPESAVSSDEMVETLRRSVDRGDTSKIPSIAALLGRASSADDGDDGSNNAPLAAGADAAPGGAPQPLDVRLAAVEALQKLVPAFPRSWPGLSHVLELLRRVAGADESEEVRVAALRALRDVASSGDAATLAVVRGCLLQGAASEEVREEAVRLLSALAVRGEVGHMRIALLALAASEGAVREGGLATLRQICGPRGRCPGCLEPLGEVARSHADVEVRAAAMELVLQVEDVGGREGTAVALAGLEDPEEQVALAALATLCRLSPRGTEGPAPAALSELAQRPARPATLRAAALDALVELAPAGAAGAAAAAAAARLLGDRDNGVRAAALNVVKRVSSRGDENVEKVLVEYLGGGTREEVVLESVLQALDSVAHPGSIGSCSQALHAFLGGGADGSLKLLAEQVLRRLQ